VARPDVRLSGGPVSGASGVSGVSDVVGGRGADVWALPIRPGEDGPRPEPGAAGLARDVGVDLATVLTREQLKGDAGEVSSVPVPDAAAPVGQLVLVGVGDRSPLAYRRAGAALARRVTTHAHVATTVVEHGNAESVRAFAEGLLLASYSFSLRTGEQKPTAVKRVTLVVRRPETRRQALDRAVVTAKAVWLARDLANMPSLTKTPAWLAGRARRVARAAGLQARVWDEHELAAGGFGGILGVGAGSSRPPRLIQLSYVPDGADERTRHVVLIGKGITFDSGGLSLKRGDAMVPMKADMAGGGAVIAVMGALRELGVRVRVTGLVAAAENLPSGSALRPGDVLRQYGGRTVEVLNTDAEGRLVLADALAYADRELTPDVVVDIATLTGAATLALSRRVGALFATDDRLASALLAAGAASGDRLWRMPLVDDYRPALDSPVADLAHVPRDRKVQGGAITAALFLREFAGARPWAHLDIAGPGKVDFEEHEITKGGTGFGVRVLLRWLEPRPRFPSFRR
jgi:leucyl aminopeptidase